MSNLSVFNFQEKPVRVQIVEGTTWFCLPDVCKILEIINPRQILQKQLNGKGVSKIYTPTNGGNQYLAYVDEPNLYRVIFRSNKTEAEIFQDWVFEEVLPSIRKNGTYQIGGSISPSPANSMFNNLKEGRYLLHIRNGETLIRDINTCSIIDTQVTEQVVRDLIKVQKANAEMVNRLAILSGCASKTQLENPIDIQISQGNFKPLQHSIDVTEPEPIAPQPLPETKPDINLIRQDRVALAKAYLNVVGQHGDGYKLARELGVHQSTGHKIMTSLYRIGNRDVYDDVG